MSLQCAMSGTSRRRAGRWFATSLIAGSFVASLSIHAEPIADAPSFAVAIELDTGGKIVAPQVFVKTGEQFDLVSADWRVEMTVRKTNTSSDVLLAGKLFKGLSVVSTPTLITKVNETAAIKVQVEGSCDPLNLAMVVSPTP